MTKLLLVWLLITNAPDVGDRGAESVSVYATRALCEKQAEQVVEQWSRAGTTRIYATCEPRLVSK